MEIVLIRGLPGSGKSTIAKGTMFENFKHYEADQFFTDTGGAYKYDSKKIKAAHDWCQRETIKALEAGYSVVISNTFTRRFEMEPYVKMSQRFRCPIRIIEATGNWQNVHGVPDDVIERMQDRWESV